MSFAFGASSLAKLALVEPGLRSVAMRAIQISTVDIVVVEGVRSVDQMCINYGKGRTVEECAAKGVAAHYAAPHLSKVTWLAHPLQSKHGLQADGFGHAVDLAPWVNGAIAWNDIASFKAIDVAMVAAAAELGVKEAWGGDWAVSKDFPHYET